LSSQLEQLLGYLEREGVTEVLFGSGRPIAMRKGGAITNITARPLSADQLSNMVKGSEISGLIPDADGEGRSAEITVGRRRAMAQVARRGHEIVVSLTRIEGATAGAAATLPIARVATPRPEAEAPRAKTPTRSKTPTSAPRSKTPTSAPRAKTPTRAKTGEVPRTKTGTATRMRGSTAAPRTKAATTSPRKKGATAAPATKARTTTANRPASLVAPGRPTPQVPPMSPERIAAAVASAEGALDFSLDDGIELGAPVDNARTIPVAPRHDEGISLGALDGGNFELDLAPPQSFEVDFSTSPPQPHARAAAPSAPPGTIDVDFSTSPPQAFAPDLGFAKPRQEEFAKPRSEEFAKPRGNEGFAKPRGNEGFARINTGGFAKPQPISVPSSIPAQPQVKDAFAKTAQLPAVSEDPYGKTAPLGVSTLSERTQPIEKTPVFGPGSNADRTLPFATSAADTLPFSKPARAQTQSDGSPQPIETAGTQPIQVVRSQLPPQAARSHSPAFSALVEAARELGASDLHIAGARVTSVRVNGELIPLEQGSNPLSAQGAEDLLLPLLDAQERATLDKVGYVDLALEAPGGGRLRANISRQQQGLKGTFRLALAAPATLEQLGLPAELAKVVAHHQGLVVIAGPSGHGKTTTLAALVDLLNSTKPYHILSIEDPVEIVHQRKQAVISQREAGRHTQSFARGLKASLREDPDVIVIGELRDRESVEIALTAAETGHLVIATMATPSASKTIDRLIDMFPPEEHSQVRASVAGALRAIVAQRLLPKRGGGIVPAIELVTGVLPLAVLIREDKLYQLPNLLQRGRAFGMIRFDESLVEHVRAGRIDEATALAVAENKKELAVTLKPQQPQVGPAPSAAKTSPLWGFGKNKGGDR